MYASKLFVAAIDFGSNYTGYAFSNVNQPDCIYTFDWKHNHLVSTKVPTAVLLNAKKEFLAFGYDAETKYMQSLEHDSDEEDSGEEKDVLYYFRKFNTIFHTEVCYVHICMLIIRNQIIFSNGVKGIAFLCLIC